MKKHYRIGSLIIPVILILALAGCSSATPGKSSTGKSQENPKDIKIDSISVSSAEINDENIWKTVWPSGYYQDAKNLILFDNSREMTEKEKEYLFNYVNNLPECTTTDSDRVYLGEISLLFSSGKDYKKHEIMRTKYIYNEYPEGYDEFINTMNKLCGGDKTYLSMNKNLIEVTPELFTFRTGINDNSVYGGTVQDYIDFYHIDAYEINHINTSDVRKRCTYFSIVKLLPYEFSREPSTEEEWYAFACRLADELGIDHEKIVKKKAEYEEYEWYSIETEEFNTLRIYRTEAMNSSQTMHDRGTLGEFRIFESTTSPYQEPSGYALYNFVYSIDRKFAVATETSTYFSPSYNEEYYENLKKLGEIVTSVQLQE